MIRELRQHDELPLLADDPVRPHITDRIGPYRRVLVLEDQSAVLCLSVTSAIPTSEGEIFNPVGQEPLNKVAVFYTLWSYKRGSGRKIAKAAVTWVKKNFPYVDRIVTFSPKTEMAERFHLSNRAVKLQENEDSINYEYPFERLSEWA